MLGYQRFKIRWLLWTIAAFSPFLLALAPRPKTSETRIASPIPGPSLQRIRASNQWSPIVVIYNGWSSFGQPCASEDMIWQGAGTGGDLQPLETRQVQFKAFTRDGWGVEGNTVNICTVPQNGIGQGNAVLRVRFGTDKGTKDNDVEFSIIGDGPDLRANGIPVHNPAVLYNGGWHVTANPHGTFWNTCPVGSPFIWSIWGSQSGSGAGGGWIVQIRNLTNKTQHAGVYVDVFSQDCTSEQLFAPEYRAANPFLQAILDKELVP